MPYLPVKKHLCVCLQIAEINKPDKVFAFFNYVSLPHVGRFAE